MAEQKTIYTLSNEPQPGTTFHNPKPVKTGQRFVLRLECCTDKEPGWFHNPADLMQWLASHPFIHSAKLLEIGEAPTKPRSKKTSAKDEGMKS